MPTRAKLPEGEGKRVPLNMRTTKEIRSCLERAAADSGRSLAQEVEFRLEQSFQGPRVDPKRQVRIEALRAASRVVASRRWWERLTFRGKPVSPGKATVLLAEVFARYLETGEP